MLNVSSETEFYNSTGQIVPDYIAERIIFFNYDDEKGRYTDYWY